MNITRLRQTALACVPLALHVIPTLVIGFGFVIPASPIAGINQYTIGFGAAVLGFIPTYFAGLALGASKGQK